MGDRDLRIGGGGHGDVRGGGKLVEAREKTCGSRESEFVISHGREGNHKQSEESRERLGERGRWEQRSPRSVLAQDARDLVCVRERQMDASSTHS